MRGFFSLEFGVLVAGGWSRCKQKNIRWESRSTIVANTKIILSPGSFARVLLLDSKPGAVTVRE